MSRLPFIPWLVSGIIFAIGATGQPADPTLVATTATSISANAFTVAYPAEDIANLRQKIDQARYPDEVSNARGTYGFEKDYLQALMNYWRDDFDFDAHQERLNRWNQYTEEIDGFQLHYVHEKSGRPNATPVVLLHGWPSTFLQMNKIIPLLTSPDNKNELAFDVVVISLPGYAFSEIPSKPGMAVHQMAELMHRLMTDKLGYDQFVLRASDIGAGVAKEWALAHPEQVQGLHLSGSSPYVYQVPENLSAAEETFLQDAQTFMQRQGAYAALHSTEPQTVAYALNDSPVGLAAWILERYQSWTDHGGDLETVYTKDDLLDILTVYWMTQTINASMRSYFESATVPSPHQGQAVTVPTAFLMLANDIATAPRAWEARTYANIVQWNEHPSGGHFAEWEKPELVAEDLRAFCQTLNDTDQTKR